MTIVRHAASADFEGWRALYRGYADFYELEQTDGMAERVWGRTMWASYDTTPDGSRPDWSQHTTNSIIPSGG